MKKVSMGIAAMAVAFLASPSFAGEMTCKIEPVPAVPAAFESSEQKAAVKEAVLGFIKDSNDYLACLEAKERSLGEEITDEQKAEILAAYNGNIDNQELVAAQYNDAAKAFNGE